MPHLVELDLTHTDFRQYYVQEPVADVKPHWLLGAVYGRELLKAKLRKVRPDLKVPVWRDARELDDILEGLIDQMGLREWPEPVSVQEKIRYLRLVLAMKLAVENGTELPSIRR